MTSNEESQPPHAAVRDSDTILRIARERVQAVVPDADLLALSVVFTLVRAAEQITYQLEVSQRPMGWTWPGFRVLFWIWLLGPLEPRAIASLASTSRASISSALNTLERDGFVTRTRESHDRRLVTVELTGRGREQIEEAFKATNERERAWMGPFTVEEQTVLADLLRRLLARVLDRSVIDDQEIDD